MAWIPSTGDVGSLSPSRNSTARGAISAVSFFVADPPAESDALKLFVAHPTSQTRLIGSSTDNDQLCGRHRCAAEQALHLEVVLGRPGERLYDVVNGAEQRAAEE